MKEIFNPLKLQTTKSIFLSALLPEVTSDFTVTDQYMINYISLWKGALTEGDHLYFLKTFLRLCQNEKNIPLILKYQVPYYVIHSYSSISGDAEFLNELFLTLQKDNIKEMPKYVGLYQIPIEYSFMLLHENYQLWNTTTLRLFIQFITLTIKYHVRDVESIGEMEIEILNLIFQQEPLVDIIELVNQILHSKKSENVVEILKDYCFIDTILLKSVTYNFDIDCMREIIEIISHICRIDSSYVEYLTENCNEYLTSIYGIIKGNDDLLAIYNSIFS